MLKNSQLLRFGVAAGLYLLLMWGYTVLPNAQWFAAFLALVMGTMAVFWISESAADIEAAAHMRARVDNRPTIGPATWTAAGDQSPGVDLDSDNTVLLPSLEASVLRLDSLKSELMLQYAQFGRDQSLLNSNGLGSWHGHRNPGAR